MPAGISQIVGNHQVGRWLEMGGAAEDQVSGLEMFGAVLRSRHHFHDPLKSWDRAGLDAISICPPLILSGQASVRWAQNPDQGISGAASWHDARRAFRDALTLGSRVERDLAWARTFTILGQQMHLVADLASPAHTRNDQHCPGPDGFEHWVAQRENEGRVAAALATPVKPELAIFASGVPITDRAAVPIARLWDTDRFDGTNPDVTTTPPIGLAEYSSANFLSAGTVFRKRAWPAPTSVELGPPEPEPRTGQLRRYVRKVRDGEAVNHLAVPGALYRFLPDALKDRELGLDDRVHGDYAAKLLPRAVGYSTALLDYFFRGRLAAAPYVGNDGKIYLDIQNASNETMTGTLELYAVRDGAQTLVTTFGSRAAPLTVPARSWTSQLLPTSFAPARRFALVFTGRLGDETVDDSTGGPGAVAGVLFDVDYVFAVQEAFEGPMAQYECKPRVRSQPKNVLEQLRCIWYPASVRIPGHLVTTSDRPIVDTVTIRGGGSSTIDATFLVDGVVQPSGTWQRQNPDERDPRTFEVRQTGIDVPPSYFLDVRTRDGNVFQTQLATLDAAGSIIGRSYWASIDWFFVQSMRSAFLEVAIEDQARSFGQAQFVVREIGGRTNPTTSPPRIVGGEEFEEGVHVRGVEYDDIVYDFLEAYGTPEEAQPEYSKLPALPDLIDPLLGRGPQIPWTATVERDYRPADLEFFRVFGIDAPRYVIPLGGQ